MIEAVILHIGVSGFEMMLDAHIALTCQGLQFNLVPSILILNHWHGSPAVGEWHGKVLQIEEMIVSTKYSKS